MRTVVFIITSLQTPVCTSIQPSQVSTPTQLLEAPVWAHCSPLKRCVPQSDRVAQSDLNISPPEPAPPFVFPGSVNEVESFCVLHP